MARNVIISAGGTSGGPFTGANPSLFTPSSDNATVSIDQIGDAIRNGTSVTIGTGTTGAQDGDISADLLAIRYTSPSPFGGATLTLDAADDIRAPGLDFAVRTNFNFIARNAVGDAGSGVTIGRQGFGSPSNLQGGDLRIENIASGQSVGGVSFESSVSGVNALNILGGAGNITQGAGATISATTLTANTTSNITLNQGGNSFGTARGSGNNVTLASQGALTLGAWTATGSLSVTSSNGSAITASGAIQTANGFTLSTAGAANVGGVVSGAGGLVQAGTGVTTLSASNTYTGGTTVSAGTLQFDNASALGSGTVTIAPDATLRANVAGGATIGNRLAFNGAITNAQTGDANALTLTGGVAFANATARFGSAGDTGVIVASFGGAAFPGAFAINVDGGTLRAGNGVLGDITGSMTVTTVAAGAVLDFARSPGSIWILQGSGFVQQDSGTLRVDGGTFAGTIRDGSGALGLNKATTGTLTLSGTNTYTGATTINGGTLAVSGGSAIADAGAVTLVAAGTFAVNASETIGSLAGTGGTVTIAAGQTLTTGGANASTSYAGTIAGAGALTKTGTGTLTLSGANTYSGTTTIFGGTLQIGDGGTTGSIAGNVVNNAALVFNRSNDSSFDGAISGSGSVQKLGAGTLTLGGASTYTGATTVSAGILDTRNGSALGAASAGTTVADGATLRVQGGITTAEALTLSGTGGVSERGALQSVAGNNTVTGAITLAADARINSDDGLLTLAGAIAGSGTPRDLTLGGAGNGLTSGAIGGNIGNVTKDGTGTWTLTGPSTVGGIVTVDGGTLVLSDGANLSNSGIRGSIADTAGSTAVMTVTGANTNWSNAGILYVGYLGTGTLNVAEGADVSTSSSAYVGAQGAGNGTVNVSGVGSTWTVGGALYVGDFATGALNVTGGAAVTSTFGIVGNARTSSGTATVTGAGSSWTVSDDLTVGEYGPGVLAISNAGTVSVGTGAAAGRGTVTVGGVGSGTGTLVIGSAEGTAATAAGILAASSVEFETNARSALVFNHTGTAFTFAPEINGAGAVRQIAGTTILTGANAYTGTTAINGGTLLLNGSLAQASAVTVASTGTLGGTGTVNGTVGVNSGGTLSGGTVGTVGTLATGSLTLAEGASFRQDVTVGSGDLVNVTGGVSLGGTLALNVTGTFAQAVGLGRVFVNNDLTDTVTGFFGAVSVNGTTTTLASAGSTFTVDGRQYVVDYRAGDGNDVAIRDVTFVPGPPQPPVTPQPPTQPPAGPSDQALLQFGAIETNPESPAGAVYALYEALLNRAPDPLGLEGFTTALQNGASLEQVANALLFSTERGMGAGDPTAYVQSLYQNLLNRPADASGLATFTNELANGVSPATVAVQLATSAEARAVLSPTFANGVFVPDASEASIARLYYGLLERAPDSGGLRAYSAFIETSGGGAQGEAARLLQVASSFLNSPEYARTHGTLSDAAYVAELYQDALGRTPDPGQATYLNQLAQGVSRAQVALEITQSPEAQIHLVGVIQDGALLAA